jgi:hypothetical protein
VTQTRYLSNQTLHTSENCTASCKFPKAQFKATRVQTLVNKHSQNVPGLLLRANS